jgi:hypothetical protein
MVTAVNWDVSETFYLISCNVSLVKVLGFFEMILENLPLLSSDSLITPPHPILDGEWI